MQLDAFNVLIGLRLSIIRRAADMLGLHFGSIREHPSGEGTIADYALHVQCPWRIDGPSETVTGRDDLWEYAGPGQRPPNWSYDDGASLQDNRFASLFLRDEDTRSWVNENDAFTVRTAQQTKRGDVTIALENAFTIRLFPASSTGEAWRLFQVGGRHVVFPNEQRDYAISRRTRTPTDTEWEAWLKVVEAPNTATAMQAPPIVVISPEGTRYRCGRCGRVLVIAEFGALKGFVIHCTACDSHNEVSI